MNILGLVNIEAHTSGSPLSLIAAERRRQVEELGYTAEKDDGYTSDELARAAARFAAPSDWGKIDGLNRDMLWPYFWSGPPENGDRLRELTKAGALIVAEIERLQRKGVA